MLEAESKTSLDRRLDGHNGAYRAAQSTAAPSRNGARAGEARSIARLELALSASGIGLSGFMASHMGLLFTVLLGANALDTLASFLERYYLLHAFVPVLLVMFVGHVYLAARKVPTAFPQQRALMRHMRSLRHLDTWTWAAQVLTGIALLALASIHLWVVLADLPIEASKSGARVFGVYLWFYLAFIVVVEAHMSIGLYRLAVKWGLATRPWAHRILTAWTVAILSLGFAILVALYRIGGSQ